MHKLDATNSELQERVISVQTSLAMSQAEAAAADTAKQHLQQQLDHANMKVTAMCKLKVLLLQTIVMLMVCCMFA